MIFVEYEEKQGNEWVQKSARFKTESAYEDFLTHYCDSCRIVSVSQAEVVVGLDLSDIR